MPTGELRSRIPTKNHKSGIHIALVSSAVAIAIALAVAFANVLLLPLRVYFTGTARVGVIDQCEYREATGENGFTIGAYFVRIRGSTDFIPTSKCDPKVTGNPVTVFHSDIAAKTIAVRGYPTLIEVCLSMGPLITSYFLVVLMLSSGFSVYRATTILQFGLTEFKSAWSPLSFTNEKRWKSILRASEVLTDFLFLGLIVVTVAIVVYSIFRTTLYIHGPTWFSVFAVSTLGTVWSSIPLRVIRLSWKTYKSPLWGLLRNLVAAFLMFGSIRTISKMPHNADLYSVHGLFALVLAVLKASIGL